MARPMMGILPSVLVIAGVSLFGQEPASPSESGVRAGTVWPQRQALLLEWLPNVEGFTLPGATHLLHVQNPRGMADRLVIFFAHHGLVKK